MYEGLKRLLSICITSCCIIPCISWGTPGMLINIFPFFSNNIPGAVPRLFKITLQVSGTSPCFILRSVNGRLKTSSKRYFTLSRAALSAIIFPPKYLHSKGLVISSAVGPRPPVIKIISECAASSSRAFHISSHTSPTATRRFIRKPALFNCCAIQALLVSTTWPISSSSPMVMMDVLVINIFVFAT